MILGKLIKFPGMAPQHSEFYVKLEKSFTVNFISHPQMALLLRVLL
jgi:hypothetical protein